MHHALRVAGMAPANGPLRTGALGTFPTYLTGDGRVVKLFPEVWDGPASFDTEVAANRALVGSGLPVPSVLAVGQLYEDGEDEDGWRWPFLVFEEAPGVPFAVARDALGPAERNVLAADAGTFLRALHALPPPSGSWARYLSVLERRRRQVPDDDLTRHGHLAPHLLAEVRPFLERHPDEVRFDASAPPTFVHADLHHDHLFVDPRTGHLLSVIDWGDTLEGDRWYDFGALVTGSFRGDRSMIDACYEAYGERPDPEVQLARMLLHGFDLFDAVPDDIRKGSRTLAEVARRLG